MTPCALCPEPRVPTRSLCRAHYNAKRRRVYDEKGRERRGYNRKRGTGPCPLCKSTRFHYYEEQGRTTRRCKDCAARHTREYKERKRLEASGMTPVEAAWAVSAGAA